MEFLSLVLLIDGQVQRQYTHRTRLWKSYFHIFSLMLSWNIEYRYHDEFLEYWYSIPPVLSKFNAGIPIFSPQFKTLSRLISHYNFGLDNSYCKKFKKSKKINFAKTPITLFLAASGSYNEMRFYLKHANETVVKDEVLGEIGCHCAMLPLVSGEKKYLKCFLHFLVYFKMFRLSFFSNVLPDVRLVGDGSGRRGRVEVFVDGAWLGVRKERWTSSEANVLCHQLGYELTLCFSWIAMTHRNVLWGVSILRNMDNYDRFKEFVD